jgi:hypothetical protein
MHQAAFECWTVRRKDSVGVEELQIITGISLSIVSEAGKRKCK